MLRKTHHSSYGIATCGRKAKCIQREKTSITVILKNQFSAFSMAAVYMLLRDTSKYLPHYQIASCGVGRPIDFCEYDHMSAGSFLSDRECFLSKVVQDSRLID